MHGVRCGRDTPTVPLDTGIDPVLISIAVECFTPVARTGKADPIADTGKVGKVQDHQHVEAFPHDPAVKREDTVLIVHMHHTKALSVQPG